MLKDLMMCKSRKRLFSHLILTENTMVVFFLNRRINLSDVVISLNNDKVLIITVILDNLIKNSNIHLIKKNKQKKVNSFLWEYNKIQIQDCLLYLCSVPSKNPELSWYWQRNSSHNEEQQLIPVGATVWIAKLCFTISSFFF